MKRQQTKKIRSKNLSDNKKELQQKRARELEEIEKEHAQKRARIKNNKVGKESDEYLELESSVDKAMKDLDDNVDAQEVLDMLQDTFYDSDGKLIVLKKRTGHPEGT